MTSKPPKMRVTWREDRRRWEVWEDYGLGKGNRHHSSWRTEAEAKSAARAQAAQDRRDATAARDLDTTA